MKNWYMLNIRQNSEKKICALLKKKKIDTFCPFVEKKVNHLGRPKTISDSLFPLCLFARMGEEDFEHIPQLKSVVSIVYWKSKYAVIPNEEIEIIKEFVQLYQNVKIEKSTVQPGEILFTNSPDYTLNTNSISVSANLLKVQLPSIGYTLVVESERANEFKITGQKFSRPVKLLFNS